MLQQPCRTQLLVGIISIKEVIMNLNMKTGRPPKRADTNVEHVGVSFRLDPRLKNLLLDIADGYDITMTELLLLFALKESGLESLDDYEVS